MFSRVAGVVLAGSVLFGSSGTARADLDLARDGHARVDVVVADDALPSEATAAAELAEYLGRIANAPFELVTDSAHDGISPSIQIGPTRLALARDPGLPELGREAWVVDSRPGVLFLYGGRPRGTLYAVYHFLEEWLGVRWWTPFEETVPARSRLRIPWREQRGEPGFAYRDVQGVFGPVEFRARNRHNGYFSLLPFAYGGTEGYGPPNHVHNFYDYAPPDELFAEHPEFFSEIDGVRTGERAQLCLTNEALRRRVAAQLDGFIRSAKKQARESGIPPPPMFGFSANDWAGACTCDVCEELYRREESGAAPLVEFVNHIADSIRYAHPDVLIDTLAYHSTFPPPATLRYADNVVLRVSGLQRRDFSKPVTHAVHEEYRQAIDAWKGKTATMRIWDYAVAYGRGGDLPLPNLGFMADDFRYYAEHGAEGIFIQINPVITSDMRDLKLWVLSKLLEDPYLDSRRLVRDFTEGYYGPAGRPIRRYLRLLERAAAREPSEIGYPSRAEDYRYIDLRFVRRAHALFDVAQRRAAGDPVLSRRVRHARLSLDRATLRRLSELGEEWVDGGRPARNKPPHPGEVAERYRRTRLEMITRRLPEGERAAASAEVERELAELDGWLEEEGLPARNGGVDSR